MADSAVVLRSLFIFCLFLSFKVSTTDEITTNHTFNTTVSDDRNVTSNVTDSYTTAQPPESETTQPIQIYSSTEQPGQPTPPAEPLPASGRLLTPATNVDSVCPCDQSRGVCDINCCCDRDCGEEVALFTGCSVTSVSGNKQLCSHDVALYSLGSTVDGYSDPQVSVTKETSYDIFCIQSQNSVDGFSHPSPVLPTNGSFDSLFQQFTSFMFDLEGNRGQLSPAELRASSGYQFGDEMLTAGEGGDRGLFSLPAPGLTADCVDTSPAAFLKDQSRACSRRLVLHQDCSTSAALNMDTYTNIHVCAVKNKDAALVPVEVASVVLQSVDQTQTELSMSEREDLSPVLLNPGLCANVVLKVGYVVTYSPAGQILNMSVSLVLGFVRKAALPLKQDFQITFVQQNVEQATVHYSGNPGYVVGLPLVSGTRAADGIVRSIDLRDTLSLLHGAEDQDCLHGPHQRSPVLFGLDSLSGCTLRLEDAANCSLVSQLLLDVLRGTDSPQYVASLGNSPLNNPLDWVQVHSNFNPGDAQSCSIPLSFHLEVEWTKHGSLVNPQPQIVSIKEVIQTNSTSLWFGDSSFLSVRTSVAFIPVSAAALPGYRVTPTINAKLPFDFFFPFV
ncbi:tectonic-1 isoform X1 [Seriola lalandi dorsalis]|nr:tectonic-1 isoform X1 [Seriola lalandi dorsalis]XP_056239499.1 tectonic-1 isoform X1 [Seriola aureovittata]